MGKYGQHLVISTHQSARFYSNSGEQINIYNLLPDGIKGIPVFADLKETKKVFKKLDIPFFNSKEEAKNFAVNMQFKSYTYLSL